jgi:hypothetical protein
MMLLPLLPENGEVSIHHRDRRGERNAAKDARNH